MVVMPRALKIIIQLHSFLLLNKLPQNSSIFKKKLYKIHLRT